MALKFKLNESTGEITSVYKHNMTAFSDTQDFEWTEGNIKDEVQKGWELYSASENEQIIAALFVKREKDVLYTKNTPIKMEFQGKGYSHDIKDFYESLAKGEGINQVISYCSPDNFRMISLNERHGYAKTGKTLDGSKSLVEWIKDIDATTAPRDEEK